MAKWISLFAIAALAVACGDKKTEGEKTPTAGSGTARAPEAPDEPEAPDDPATGGADTGKTDKPTASGEPTCDCRMLTTASLGDLEGGGFEKQCEGLKLVSGSNCEQFDTLRNCIYAAHGNTFKRKQWQKRFGGTDWYKPRADFKPSELSELELANVRALKDRAKTCTAKAGGKVSAEHVAAIKAWFGDRAKKTPAIVWHEMEDEPVTDDAKKQIENRLGHWEMTPKIEFWYRARPSADGLNALLKGKTFRTVAVGDCYVCAADEEDCEGGCDTFEVMLDNKNKIIALYLTVAAACPYVYARSGAGTLAMQGEILRHLDAPAREATQRLALDVACEGPITVRLAEEKPEVTFLDAVHLRVDGVRHEPMTCEAAHCEDDGRYTRLGPGESLELVFDVPASSCERVELVADGFYMPL